MFQITVRGKEKVLCYSDFFFFFFSTAIVKASLASPIHVSCYHIFVSDEFHLYIVDFQEVFFLLL
ncbi:hypothetical protein Sjap_008963 [Stephania japonica]|uniref:Uncharacterized protein n=1 Tax=Stephania japonica TaxID=461633 RepID=A0AAP0PCW0_9MAGN